MGGKFLSQEKCDRVKRLYGMYPHETVLELAGISSATLHALRHRGFKAAKREARPMPSDFPIVAPGMKYQELCDHYKAGYKVVARWRRQCGIEPLKGGVKRLPVHPDFEAFMRNGGTHASAMRHFGVSTHTITRWKEAVGLPMQRRAFNQRKKAPLRPINRIGWADTYFQHQGAH